MKTITIDSLERQAEDDEETYTWQEAMEYSLTLGNRWRLPSIGELFSIIDFGSCNPACKIESCVSSYYWSSTTSTNYTGYAWYVDFYYGYVRYCDKYYHYYVRCVRNIK